MGGDEERQSRRFVNHSVSFSYLRLFASNGGSSTFLVSFVFLVVQCIR